MDFYNRYIFTILNSNVHVHRISIGRTNYITTAIMSSSTESKAGGGGNKRSLTTRAAASRPKNRWTSSVSLSSTAKSQPATTSITKKKVKKSNKSSRTAIMQVSTSDSSSDNNNDNIAAATGQSIEFLDELVITNYNLKEHTKKLENNFRHLQQDVARLSEHSRQLRLELRTSEAKRGELGADVSVLREEVSAALEETATQQDRARREEKDNKHAWW